MELKTRTAAEAAFADVLQAAQGLMTSEMTAFNGPLPNAPFVRRTPHAIPMLDRLDATLPTPEGAAHNRFTQSVLTAAPFAEWRRSYSEAQVGADFLARYGWFELIGPEGHFHSDTFRAYVGVWGKDLYYPWHNHEAEEIYYCVSGGAIFEAEGDPVLRITPGQMKQHIANQLHAMTTTDQALLTFVLWRGPGLAGKPQIGAGSAP